MKNIGVFVKIKEKIKEVYEKNRKLFFVAIALILVGLFVLFFPFNNLSQTEIRGGDEVENYDNGSYVCALENKLENMLLKISNISFAKVLIMVEESPRENFLVQKETSKTGDTVVEKEEIVYEKNGSAQVPVTMSVTYPNVTGVLLVLNKIDASTKLSIQNSLAGVLNVDVDCIFILQDR